MLTSYQARLFAEELQLHYPAGEVRSLTTTLLGSRVDLNPHQVDAALFAFRSLAAFCWRMKSALARPLKQVLS